MNLVSSLVTVIGLTGRGSDWYKTDRVSGPRRRVQTSTGEQKLRFGGIAVSKVPVVSVPAD